MTPDAEGTPSPALSDEELRETLDLLSTVLASVSDRVDAQTETLGRVNKTATEARQAAFAAKAQTDPERYGDLVGQAVDAEISDTLRRLERMGTDLLKVSNHAEAAIAKAGKDQQAVYDAMRERERKVDRFKARLPWFGLGAFVLAVVMTVGLPRFMAGDGATCTVMGAEWTRTTDGREACVFYGE